MKILLVTNDFRPMTGGEATWYEAVCGSVPLDCVEVLAPRMQGDKDFDRRQPYQIIRRRVPTQSYLLARLAQMLLLFMHAATHVRRDHIDAIHIGHLYLGPIGLALKYLRRTPYTLYLHGGEMAPYVKFRGVRAVVRMVVRHAQIVIFNSAYTRRHYEAMGISHSRTEILTMSVDARRFRPGLDGLPVRASYGLNGARVILTVGRLIERKGHDTVIRALDRIRRSVGPVKYLIVGEGPDEARLRRLARDLGCESDVIFAGSVREEALPSFYAACDVFVMPSRSLAGRDGVEGFGIVFLEAGACGKPVIGGRSGGVADAVINGVTGYLVDPLDVGEVSGTITRLLVDRAEAVRMGKQGRLRVVGLGSAWKATLARVWASTNGGGIVLAAK